ncbi:hypothetical protein EVAR_5311_1 [Eumeta japonica]|uniref:Uncharacterized protein n=1 Tax=Eumeta variegata TaxID=151549 RepID=A0A4C1TM71_EUMVA|nr:hypothetical protein EVAR_5311_1 [Eumeta japonica]
MPHQRTNGAAGRPMRSQRRDSRAPPTAAERTSTPRTTGPRRRKSRKDYIRQSAGALCERRLSPGRLRGPGAAGAPRKSAADDENGPIRRKNGGRSDGGGGRKKTRVNSNLWLGGET